MPPHARCARSIVLWLVCLATLSACSEKVTAPPEPPMSVRRGDDAFHYQQYRSAIDAYRTYLDQTERGEYTARALYKTALAEYRLGQYPATLATLEDLDQRYPTGRWVQVEALRGDAERARGNTMLALQSWEKAWKVAGERDRPKIRQRLTSAARDLSDPELARARRLVTDDEVAALLDRQIADRQPPGIAEPVPETGDESHLQTTEVELPAARPIVEEPAEPVAGPRTEARPAAKTAPNREPARPEVAAVPGGPAWSPPPAEPAEAAPMPVGEDTARHGTRIGCLLPLSGSTRHLGERALRGLRLGFGADGERLIITDTESDSAAALRGFDQLARNPQVLAVIGPVRNEDAEAIARRAEETHVPLLLLSQREGLSGQFVLPVGVTPASQVKGLLEYAMGRVRLRRFGVLYPTDAAAVVSAFRSEVERRGGTLVGTVGYSPVDKSLLWELGTVHKWRDRHNLQAVFLADDAAIAAEFARYLHRDMPDVTLLGVHSWEPLAGQHNGARLNGILFAQAFFPDSERPATREFVKQFEQLYHEVPGVVEAEAYDAAALAKRAIDRGVQSPADMAREFQALGFIDGAAGDVAVSADGLHRRAFVLQVSSGTLQEVGEPASHEPSESAAAPSAAPPPANQPEGPAVDEATRSKTVMAVPLGAEARPIQRVGAAHATDAKVACLLPLTGPDQAYGKRALAGLRLAFADAPQQLLVRDTGGDPVSSTDWLNRLQDDPEVLAVIGPLRSSEAEVAAPLAEREQLPLLLLSQRDGLAGRFAVQVAMTRAQQVRLLVRYAVDTLKHRRFGIVYPNDGYGMAFADAFKKEAVSQHARVAGTHAYPPGTTEFASAVHAVRGWQRSGLDALFIPDAAPTATALAAQIRRDMPGIVLLGTESWNDARTLANAGSAIDGALFADAFFAQSSRPSTRAFVDRFEQRAGEPPTVFEAQAFDAGMLIRRVLAGGAASREQVVAQLAALGRFEGAGELRSSPDGMQRAVSILRYRDGKVEEVMVGGVES